MAELQVVRANLRHLGIEPWLSDDAIAMFNRRQLHAAVLIEREELLVATRKLTEQ